MPNKEIRAFNFEVRAEQIENKGRLTGRPIVYNSRTNLGWMDEIIEAGALDDADLRDVAFLLNHNLDMLPLARSRNNNANSTMQMTVDNDGMEIRVDLDIENNVDAKALYSAVERGDITGMSFMFTVDSDAWEDLDSDHPTRVIKAIARVFEVSAVTFPAYAATSISTRGIPDALDSARESLDSAKRAADAIKRQKAKIKLLTEVI